jgi:hypothetical protein
MYIVRVSIRQGGLPTASDAHRLRQAVLMAARHDDGLDHAFVKAGPQCLDAVLFMLGATAEVAEVNALALCDRAIRRSAMAGLRVRFCETYAVPALTGDGP